MSQPTPRRQALKFASAAGLASLLGAPSFAQDGTPLRLVVTFPPGGSTDITARILQPRLGEILKRSVVVDNKPGAASQVGTQFVAKSAPDGNTLLVCFDTHAINPIAKPKLPYDTFKDFAGVTLAVRFPLVIGASANVPARNLREFIDLARKAPGKFSYASTGVGSMNHLIMEDIKRKAGAFVLHVPYGGGGPAVSAVLGDTASLTLLSYAALRSQIAAGKIKPLAVTGAKRLPDLPDVPTVAESGYAGFEAVDWKVLVGPARLPADVTRRLHDEAEKALGKPDAIAKLLAEGSAPMAGSPAQLAAFLKAEHARWGEVVRAAGVKAD